MKHKKEKGKLMTNKDMEKPHGELTENEATEGMGNEKLFDFDKANPDNPDEVADPKSNTTSKVEELQAAVKEQKDKYLRLLAEFENYKKRTTRERLDLLNSASKDVILALLPVLDDFDRAKKSADNPDNHEQFSEGVTLVYNRLHATLQSLGLKVMDSTGQPFDPEWHDAITDVPVPSEDMKGKVIDTIEKGYLLNDKIIRHAKVVVGK